MTAPPKIGRYEIIRRLGKGMTDVYLATDIVENRPVALKLIPCAGDSTSRMVLEAERRGVALQKELFDLDPRVVQIYEFGELEGYFFIAMQYVEGRTVAQVLKADHAVDPDRAATIALEVCEQVAKFHSCRPAVVHGDIKPSNIHLGPADTVRLLDFGIAKALRSDGNATTHHFGSPGYCSPERLNRSEVDEQSDLWAVGATLYQMLAGAPPYQAENTRLLERMIRSRRAPRALPPSCPRGLRAVVTKALAPDPARRYRSARELQADLQAFLEHRPTAAEIERRRTWSPSATIDAARAYMQSATRTVRVASARLRAAGAVGYFVLGMVLWIGGALGWQAWHARRVSAAAPVSTTPPKTAAAPQPATPVGSDLAQLFVGEAERILDQYRKSSETSLQEFDWQKAELCLERAVELGRDDNQVLGELAVSRGYSALERISGNRYSTSAAARQSSFAGDQFAIAARLMPASPDPHLALARLYTYFLPNASKATSEFATAVQLGAVLGPRETAEQADLRRRSHYTPPRYRSYAWR